MKLTALIVATTIKIVSRVASFVVGNVGVAAWKRQPAQRRSGSYQDASGRDLAGRLGQRVHSPPVVDEPDDHQQPAGQQEAVEHAGVGQSVSQPRDVVSHQKAGREPPVHGKPAEGRDRDHMHVAVSRLLHCPGSPGHAAYQRRQEVGDGGRNE